MFHTHLTSRLAHAIAALTLAFITVMGCIGTGAAQTSVPGVTTGYTSSASIRSSQVDPIPTNNRDYHQIAVASVLVDLLNSASVRSNQVDPDPTNNVGGVGSITGNGFDENTLVVTKTSGRATYEIGDVIVWTISARNTTQQAVAPFVLRDKLPPSLVYLAGTSRILVNDVQIGTTDPVNSSFERQIEWQNLSVPAGGTVQVVFRTQIGAGLDIGQYFNQAVAMAPLTNGTTGTISNIARAPFSIVPTPVFDCADIIGKVFNDKNADGYPDDNEPGIAGARIVTVGGISIKADRYGRFSVPCAAIPDQLRGSNFIMKLDPASLPSGYRITTENPRVVRLTRGKVTKLNFGASIQRVVRLDLADDAWVGTSTQLNPAWAGGMRVLLDEATREPSVLRVTYRTRLRNDGGLAQRRVDAISRYIERQAKARRADLIIEKEIIRVLNNRALPGTGQQGGVNPTFQRQRVFNPQPTRADAAPALLRPVQAVQAVAGMVVVPRPAVPAGLLVPQGYDLIRGPRGARYLRYRQTGVIYATR